MFMVLVAVRGGLIKTMKALTWLSSETPESWLGDWCSTYPGSSRMWGPITVAKCQAGLAESSCRAFALQSCGADTHTHIHTHTHTVKVKTLLPFHLPQHHEITSSSLFPNRDMKFTSPSLISSSSRDLYMVNPWPAPLSLSLPPPLPPLSLSSLLQQTDSVIHLPSTSLHPSPSLPPPPLPPSLLLPLLGG